MRKNTVPNPPGDPVPTRFSWTRFLTVLAVLVVAGVAAAISFGHIQALALAHGQTRLAARALPLSVDGAVVAASLALLDAARRNVAAPFLARVMLVAGILATLGANAVSGLGHGAIGVMVAMLPALSFIGSVEVLFAMVRGSAPKVAKAIAATSTEAAPVTASEPLSATATTDPAPVAETDRDRSPVGFPRPLEVVATTGTEASPATGITTTTRAPRRSVATSPKGGSRKRKSRSPEEVFADELEAGELPSVNDIRRRYNVGHPKAQLIQQQLSQLVAA